MHLILTIWSSSLNSKAYSLQSSYESVTSVMRLMVTEVTMQGAPVPTPSCVFRLVLPGPLATTFALFLAQPHSEQCSAQIRTRLLCETF